MPSAFGRHPGAAAVIRPIVHDRAAFRLQFFPGCQPTRSFRCQPHSIPLERQLRFRRDWLSFSFGHVLCRGGFMLLLMLPPCNRHQSPSTVQVWKVDELLTLSTLCPLGSCLRKCQQRILPETASKDAATQMDHCSPDRARLKPLRQLCSLRLNVTTTRQSVPYE